MKNACKYRWLWNRGVYSGVFRSFGRLLGIDPWHWLWRFLLVLHCFSTSPLLHYRSHATEHTDIVALLYTPPKSYSLTVTPASVSRQNPQAKTYERPQHFVTVLLYLHKMNFVKVLACFLLVLCVFCYNPCTPLPTAQNATQMQGSEPNANTGEFSQVVKLIL